MDIVTYALCKGHTDKAVDDIMDIIASMEKLTMTIVDELPSVDDAEPNVIYLIDTNHDNVYEEYVLIEIGGEKELVSLGDITDLSNYYNKIETDNLLAGKQATLTWDNAPTENSTNAVNSGVVYAAVQSVANTLANLNCVMSVTSQNNVITVTYHNGTSSTITITAGIIPYDNTTSGLSATNVQFAIDELVDKVEYEHISITQDEYDALTPVEKNNGSVYFITDADAEGDFSELEDRVGDLETSNQSAVHYKGTTTTAISNGSTTNPIVIDGEEYTAVFGDIVVYGYTEFVFDGTTWSEFGRPFDTTPTSGSANAVTSDGIYKRTPWARTSQNGATTGEFCTATSASVAAGRYANASAYYTAAFGESLVANQRAMTAVGKWNKARTGDLFNIGNGSGTANQSNIVEVNSTSMNVNGDIQQNGVPIRTTTMPTITASMLGKVVQYVGVSDSNYKQGWNYVAVSDGEETPTYSWQALMDSAPTSGSDNPVTSGAVYSRTPLTRSGVNGSSAIGGWDASAVGNSSFSYGRNTSATQNYCSAFGQGTSANQSYMMAIGKWNNPRNGDLFNIGNGTSASAAGRSNIVEVNSTEMNVNGNIKRNNVPIYPLVYDSATESYIFSGLNS